MLLLILKELTATRRPTMRDPERVAMHVLYDSSFFLFRSLLNDTLPAELPAEVPVTYEVIEGGSQKGKDLLVDNRGHSFNVKRRSKSTVFWGCSVHNKKMTCPASISQRGGHFVPGRHEHCYPAQPGIAVQARMAQEVSIINYTALYDITRIILYYYYNIYDRPQGATPAPLADGDRIRAIL